MNKYNPEELSVAIKAALNKGIKGERNRRTSQQIFWSIDNRS